MPEIQFGAYSVYAQHKGLITAAQALVLKQVSHAADAASAAEVRRPDLCCSARYGSKYACKPETIGLGVRKPCENRSLGHAQKLGTAGSLATVALRGASRGFVVQLRAWTLHMLSLGV